ncbi:MAG TPA: HipA family kinase [Bryobacteraceae bacterium]|nr:HipA family kinase [Bryobacteraceae bacterium]
MLRTVQATRYVTPLREGGSLPAIVEADDLGLYVLKFRGAGQGPLALVAELVAGEIGRALGLRVPEVVLIEVDAALGRNEPDQEIRELLLASVGTNLALDYLPGSMMFDPAARVSVDPRIASEAVWFDGFITNIDRTARNPNLLWWHKSLWFIDHGASLYFHHDWRDIEPKAGTPFAAIREHVLLPWANALDEVDRVLRSRLSESLFREILDQVPENWLIAGSRDGYVDFLSRRLDAAASFVEEAQRARAALV